MIAGVLTDVCLSNTVFSAIDAGYTVQVVADASGTTSALADDVTYDRLRAAGADVTTTWGILFELYNDLSTPEGLKAEAAAGNAIVVDVGTITSMAASKIFA